MAAIEAEKHLVVVVDDHADTAEALGLILRSVGFDTAVFTRSLDFLSEFQKLDPALVLLDLAMPECDGLQVLRTLRTAIEAPVPVLVLSAQADASAVAELDRWGVTDVLRKPVVIERLLQAVDGAIKSDVDASAAADEGLQHAAKIPSRR